MDADFEEGEILESPNRTPKYINPNNDCIEEFIDANLYIPLERPQNFNVEQRLPTNIDDTDESEESSDSDSDTDNEKGTKKIKIVNKRPVKRKKYDIWSTQMQENVLAETLVSCDVGLVDRSRDVESYRRFDLRDDIKLKNKGFKRKHNQKTQNISLSRDDNDDDEDNKGSKRTLFDLTTSEDNPDEEVATDIANKLFEENEDLILRTVQVLGKKKAIEIFNETKRIELDGGMLIMNRQRRRTPGGVYLFLIRHDDEITEEAQKEIFSEQKREYNRLKKKQQRAKFKAIINKTKSKPQLPLLLSRSELEVQKAALKTESETEDIVSNPPPSPVTD